MNRLTEWDEYGNADIIELSDMMPEIYAELSFSETNALTAALNKLAAYEDAEEQGRLVVLPCKVGDEVFKTSYFSKKIVGCTVQEILVQKDGGYQIRAVDGAGNQRKCDSAERGTAWWKTREEAEAALSKSPEPENWTAEEILRREG